MSIKPNPKLTDSEREIALEIYRQKYQNFRHFDNLRWQQPTILFAAGALVLGFAHGEQGAPNSWALGVFGVAALLSGYAMHRIRGGVTRNHDLLTEVAELIGDSSIPEPKGKILSYVVVQPLHVRAWGDRLGICVASYPGVSLTRRCTK